MTVSAYPHPPPREPMGTKNNPSKFDSYANAELDEPMFVLLARDKQAPELIRRWAADREAAGEDPEIVEEARECARDCETWRLENRPKKFAAIIAKTRNYITGDTTEEGQILVLQAALQEAYDMGIASMAENRRHHHRSMPSVLGRAMSTDIRPEIRALIERGNVTPAEIKSLRCNSWEWEALVPAMNDEALTNAIEHALVNCERHRRPFATYDQSVTSLYTPELLRRFKSRER